MKHIILKTKLLKKIQTLATTTNFIHISVPSVRNFKNAKKMADFHIDGGICFKSGGKQYQSYCGGVGQDYIPIVHNCKRSGTIEALNEIE